MNRPESKDCFSAGQYIHNLTLSSPSAAGSQLTSSSLPGASFLCQFAGGLLGGRWSDQSKCGVQCRRTFDKQFLLHLLIGWFGLAWDELRHQP